MAVKKYSEEFFVEPISMSDLRKRIDGDLTMIAGHDNAFMGTVEREGGSPIACYNIDVIMNNLIVDEGMSETRATQFFHDNILNVSTGPLTPCFITPMVITDA